VNIYEITILEEGEGMKHFNVKAKNIEQALEQTEEWIGTGFCEGELVGGVEIREIRMLCKLWLPARERI